MWQIQGTLHCLDHTAHVVEGAEEVGAQGMLWEMHNMLFQHQDALDDDSLLQFMVDLSLVLEAFADDLDDIPTPMMFGRTS